MFAESSKIVILKWSQLIKVVKIVNSAWSMTDILNILIFKIIKLTSSGKNMLMVQLHATILQGGRWAVEVEMDCLYKTTNITVMVILLNISFYDGQHCSLIYPSEC